MITFTKNPVVVRNEAFGVDEHLLEVHPHINGVATELPMYFGLSDDDARIQALVEDSLRRRGLVL